MTYVFHSPHPPLRIPDVSLPELILSRADACGPKVALIDPPSGRSITFAEFAGSVRGVAGSLSRIGFRKNDVIALMSPNCPEYAVVFLAAALLGGISTTLNPTSTRAEVKDQAEDSGARYLFTWPDLLDRAGDVRGWKAILTRGAATGALAVDDLAGACGPAEPTPIDPSRDLVALPYSSGTTGTSKGVCLTHRNLVANLHQTASSIFTGEDVILGLAPFFHIYGLTVVLHLGLLLGATDVVLPRFEIQSFVETVERYGVTHANLVPPLILALAKHPGIDPARLSSLRTVQSGAAPLAPDAAAAFSERFRCRVLQGYGLTETSPVTHVAPREREDIPIESVGPPVANTECRIRDVATGRTLGPGQRGELSVRGPQVMEGYFHAPEKTREMLDEAGWLRTGDVAWADEQGNFYIVDRVKELIKYKAYPIAPAELEAILLSHPRVDDAAVVPSPDTAAGEVPKAFVVARSDLDAGELMSWVAGRVAPYKKIRRIEFVDRIPRSASGKILRRVLVERDRQTGGGRT